MEMDKIVNLDHEELVLQAHQSAEQIFRLRFQMKMGQLEGLKKLRELKKDIARIKTVERQRELGIPPHQATLAGDPGIATPAHATASATEAAPKRKARKTAKKSAGAKSKKAPKKTSTRNTKRTSKIAGKAKSAAKTKVKAAKRGKANAKKGGS